MKSTSDLCLNVDGPEVVRLSFAEFTPSQMIACGLQLRHLADRPVTSQEEIAQHISNFFYEALYSKNSGERELVLTRVYRTVRAAHLPESLRTKLPEGSADHTRCLMLLGTSGQEEAWNRRTSSRHHQLIALKDEDFLRAAPMLASLFKSFGLELSEIVQNTSAPMLLNQHNALFNVFHVEQALGSESIPAQESFVQPYGVRSVVGFGGALPDGELFAVIAFSRTLISAQVAERFNTLALQTRIVMLEHLERPLFADEPNSSSLDALTPEALTRYKMEALYHLLREQEHRMHEQSVRIERHNLHMTHILSNVQQGFVLLDEEGRLEHEHSHVVTQWFSKPERGMFVWEWIAKTSQTLADSLEKAWMDSAWKQSEQRVLNLGSFYIYGVVLRTELIRALDTADQLMVILVLTDMTSLEETEKARLAHAKAEAANHAKSQLLANMSRELRTPLNAILGYTELMLEELELEHVELQTFTKDLLQIRTSGQHLLHLLSSILDLSKIEANMVELKFETFTLQQICDESIKLCKPLIERQQNRLMLELPEAVATYSITTDQARLLQSLLNLLSNAAKFTREGIITLGALIESERSWVQIYVRDTGEGIAPEDHERIFESFSQTSNQHFAQHNGTGLGLAIVWQLVRLMEGHITLESTPKEGSTFRIHLPTVHSQARH